MKSGRVLVVDDDPDLAEVIAVVAQDLGFAVRSVQTGDALESSYPEFQPTVVFVDLQMGDTDGIEVLNYLDSQNCKAHIFVMSGYDSRVLKSARDFGLSKGLILGAALEKPLDLDVLEDALSKVGQGGFAVNETDLRRALDEGQFFPRFQPQLTFDENGGLIQSAEALVRWNHPTQGELTPDKFLGGIEKAGLMLDLTQTVFLQSLKHMQEWRSTGVKPKISINLSPTLLEDLSLPDYFASEARRAGVETKDLIFEITEDGAMSDIAIGTEILTRFRLKGFGLSIDDFGTGYSSLVELYKLPFNELKIDKEFVSRLPGDPEASVIVSVVMNLAKSLGLTVCAEGVESDEVIQVLWELGCEKLQGYAIDRPLLPDEFAKRLGDVEYVQTSSH